MPKRFRPPVKAITAPELEVPKDQAALVLGLFHELIVQATQRSGTSGKTAIIDYGIVRPQQIFTAPIIPSTISSADDSVTA